MASEEFYFYTKGMTVGYGGVPLIQDIELKDPPGRDPDTDRAERSGKDNDFKKHHPTAPLIGGAVYLDGKDISSFTGK